jgi:Tfp pilus assembly protein PilP
MRQKTRIFFMVMIALAMMGFPACKGKTPPPPKPAAPKAAPAKSPEQKVAPAPQPEEKKVEQEVYIYDAKGRRDPFQSLVEVAKKRPPRRTASLHPIENFGVDEIKLIAIAWAKDQYFAVVTLPDNKSYTIRRGTVLGLYGGKVVEITKDSVLIREQIKDYRGQLKTKDTVLRLRKEGEE